jgi:hypothetical protein
MSTEYWATYSVKDHTAKKAFVADLMLYDRIVVPFPPDDKEAVRWERKGWEPKRLERLLKIIGAVFTDILGLVARVLAIPRRASGMHWTASLIPETRRLIPVPRKNSIRGNRGPVLCSSASAPASRTC